MFMFSELTQRLLGIPSIDEIVCAVGNVFMHVIKPCLRT